jgi:hypothetical protein
MTFLRSPNQRTAIALFPGTWSKDAIADSEQCDRPLAPAALQYQIFLQKEGTVGKIIEGSLMGNYCDTDTPLLG